MDIATLEKTLSAHENMIQQPLPESSAHSIIIYTARALQTEISWKWMEKREECIYQKVWGSFSSV